VPADDLRAPLAGRFVDGHYGMLRGRVRTYVIAAHLRDHLPGPPAAVADVGGGAGNQSIPLARDGYQVTIVDPSEAMLARDGLTAMLAESSERRGVSLVIQHLTVAGGQQILEGRHHPWATGGTRQISQRLDPAANADAAAAGSPGNSESAG